MNRIRKIFEHVRADKVTRKKLISISVSFVLVLSILMVRSGDANNKYIVDKKDNVVGIHRDDTSEASTFDFKIRAESDNETVEKELTISPQIVSDKGKKKSGSSSSSTEEEINHVISVIESTRDKNIMLPTKLPNGSRLTWERTRKSGSDHLLVFAVYAVLVGLIIKESLRDESDEDEERKDIVLKLPRFTNQLMLIMNAGMIQNDAVNQICEGYGMISEEDLGFFEKSLISISKNEKKHNLGMSAAFTDFACEHTVKELMRIATIMTENEKRGSDITENLERESQYLWDTRKTIAKERGKMIDTKMACPMALLLVLLIIITMAPAMLSM